MAESQKSSATENLDEVAQREETSEEKAGREAAGVATAEQNAKLEHSEGPGRHTRQDPLDAGVPMLPGDPSEPVGPEDALGEGQTRGDYRQRVHGAHFTSDEHGLVSQNANLEKIGDVPGVKGGVETSNDDDADDHASRRRTRRSRSAA